MIEIQTQDKYNKNRKISLRIPWLHRSCLNVDINTKSAVLKLNRKLNPAILAALGSFQMSCRWHRSLLLGVLPRQHTPFLVFLLPFMPLSQHRLQWLQPLLLGPSQLSSLNYLIYPHCISRPCFAVSLSFCGYIILHYGQYNKSILIDLVCFEHFLYTTPSRSSFISLFLYS